MKYRDIKAGQVWAIRPNLKKGHRKDTLTIMHVGRNSRRGPTVYCEELGSGYPMAALMVNYTLVSPVSKGLQ